MKQQILDYIFDARDWVDQRRYWIAAGIVLVLALSCLTAIPQVPELAVRSLGPITVAQWTDVPGAVAYQLQGRANGEDPWCSVAIVWDGHQLSWPSIPGAMEYRIRAWREDGPSRWSASVLVFLPDRERQDA